MTGVIPKNFEKFGDITFNEFIENSKYTWNINMDKENTENENCYFNDEIIQKIQKIYDESLMQPDNELDEDNISELSTEIFINLLKFVDLETLLIYAEQIEKFKYLVDKDVKSKEVQDHVGDFYNQINHLTDRSMSVNGFSLFGQMFASGGDFGMMQDKMLGDKTTAFIAEAIQIYCDNYQEK
jgi:hypothetical protein